MNDIDKKTEELRMMLKEMSVFLTMEWYDWIVQHRTQHILLYNMLDEDVINLMKANGKEK